jgi:hypothetical protein
MDVFGRIIAYTFDSRGTVLVGHNLIELCVIPITTAWGHYRIVVVLSVVNRRLFV